MFIPGPFALSFYICFIPEIVLIYFLLVLLLTVFFKHNICSFVLNGLLFWLILEIGVFEIIFLLYLWGGLAGNEIFVFDLDYFELCILHLIQDGILAMFSGCFNISGGTIILKMLVLLLVLLCSACSFLYFRLERFDFCEYYVLLLFFLLGTFFIISAGDLFFMYLSIEFLSLCIYLMIVGGIRSLILLEGSFKFFILGSVSSVLFLFGICLFYGFFGLVRFEEIKDLHLGEVSVGGLELGLQCSFAFIMAIIFFKLMIFPFHFWGPDLYSGSSVFMVLFMAIVPKVVFLVIFVRFYFVFFAGLVGIWHLLFVWFVLMSLIIGIFGAFFQVEVKRLFAYSSIAHLSYIIFALATFSLEGWFVVVIYMFNYVGLMCGVFLFLMFFREYGGVEGRLFLEMRDLRDFFFLSRVNLAAVCGFSVILVSIGGLPPLAGFFSKVLVLWCLLKFHNFLLGWFVIVLSVLSCLYYIRFIQVSFTFHSTMADGWSFVDMGGVPCYFFVIVCLYNLFFVFFFDLLLLASYSGFLSLALNSLFHI